MYLISSYMGTTDGVEQAAATQVDAHLCKLHACGSAGSAEKYP